MTSGMLASELQKRKTTQFNQGIKPDNLFNSSSFMNITQQTINQKQSNKMLSNVYQATPGMSYQNVSASKDNNIFMSQNQQMKHSSAQIKSNRPESSSKRRGLNRKGATNVKEDFNSLQFQNRSGNHS